MRFKAIIIEDESLARERLKLLLKKHQDVIEIIAEASNGKEGLEMITKYKPDLIFLDIQMPGLTGFEMLQQLDEIPLVIFTTAYDEYALQAFETNTIDYLLKPIAPERLEKAVQKLIQMGSNESHIDNNLLALISKMSEPKTSFIKVKTGTITKLIKLEKICYFQSEDKYSFLHTFDKKYILSDSLNELEKTLTSQFKRIHRSCLVNIDFVKEIISLSTNKSIVVMQDKENTELPISRRMKAFLD
ncbi:LytR/AlgR family response regulator transcription factor [Candidatus Cloacimonadota bacterium]